MPATSDREGSVKSGNVFKFGDQLVGSDMSVLEFLVGVVLCRNGPSTSAAVSLEIGSWLDDDIGAAQLLAPLRSIVDRGWVALEDGLYSIIEPGIDAVRQFYAAMIRMLDHGKRFLDVALFMSLVKVFERSGVNETR